jgi:predicted nucleic acid-binding protein
VTYLLDSDIYVYWLRGNTAVRDRVRQAGLAHVSISTATLAELHYGAACSAKPEDNKEAIIAFRSGLTVLDVDERVADAFGAIKADLRQRGQLIEDIDLLIAATAQVNGLTLVTNNESHFARVSGLSLENWTKVT